MNELIRKILKFYCLSQITKCHKYNRDILLHLKIFSAVFIKRTNIFFSILNLKFNLLLFYINSGK